MQSNNQLNLTNEELNELVGGSWIENSIQSGASGGSSGDNINTTLLCVCYYHNSPSITNSNSSDCCACYCCPLWA